MRMPSCPGLVGKVARAIQPIIFVALLLPCLGSCAGSTKSLYPPRAGEAHRTVYVINHGTLHTGLAVKRSDIPRGVWPAHRDYSGFKYLEVGWGDDDGYRKPLTTGVAIKALTGSRRTVMLADGFGTLGAKLAPLTIPPGGKVGGLSCTSPIGEVPAIIVATT